MKTLNHYIISLLLIAAAIFGFTACSSEDTHEVGGGVAIALDNSRCSDVAIRQTRLFIYDTGGNLCGAYDYADAYAVASALLPLEAGHYTVAAVINADEAPTQTATLTALHEWVASQSDIDADLLSGIAEVGVTGNRVIRVSVPLDREAFSLSVLSVSFSMPETSLPDFAPRQARTRASEAGYTLRCVVELCKAGTDEVVLHKAITPELHEDGTYRAELQLFEGSYDLRLWADHALADAPLADAFYHTECLKAVTIFTELYAANIDAKDAAYGNENNITLPKDGASISTSLQRPLAKYRIVANDVETYKKLMALEPDNYPPLEDLTVTIQYEGFFPTAFNAKNSTVTDAITGIGFSSKLTDTNINSTTLNIVSDWIFASRESSVTATITVSDSKGNKVSSVSGVSIAYKQGYQTTISGKFLTAGVDVGGIDIDTDWNEIIIEF